MTNEEMVKEFQCPGCVCGNDPADCTAYKPATDSGFRCEGHVLGTIIMPMPGNIALGLPKGFNRPGWEYIAKRPSNQMLIRLWTEGTHPDWDHFNVAVWALEKDGFLFVRTYMPRVNRTAVDIIEKGTRALCPTAVNVNEFYEGMD